MGALAPFNFDGKQIDLVRRTVAKDCDAAELDLFIHICKSVRLDPLRRQIYAFVFGKDNPSNRRLSVVTAIDGYRAIAERTQNYRPDDRAPRIEYSEEAKDPAKNPLGIVRVEVTVYKHAHGEWFPVIGEAYWNEFAPIIETGEGGFEWVDTGQKYPAGHPKEGKPKKKKVPIGDVTEALDPQKPNWRKMARVMIAKCFSSDTEILTAAGFQKFSEVSAPILQVSEYGLEPVHVTPFVQNYDGQMVTLDSDDLNFCVTPNHDMVTSRGKLEAGTMFETARSRPVHFIPRIVPANSVDAEISDRSIQLAAAFLADGSGACHTFRIAVSRPYKINILTEIGGYYDITIKRDEGRVARTAYRDIKTKSDKISFAYRTEILGGICSIEKTIDLSLLGTFSRRQAKLFVDTLISFDGSDNGKGVRRFGSSNPHLVSAFEVAAVIAGYAVSNRKLRRSDIGTKSHYGLTISDRDAIGVRRWGRDYHNFDKGLDRTGLTLTRNADGKVWCVTVPSGTIVVRRNGFAMICGNCAEAQAIRRAWPDDFAGLEVEEEVDRRASIELTATELADEAASAERFARIGGANAFTVDWCDGEPLVREPIGSFGDKVLAFIGQHKTDDPDRIRLFQSRNTAALQEYWAKDKSGALELKKAFEAQTSAGNIRHSENA